jgi:hypothetical protein
MFILGATFSGKIVVGYNYLLEFNQFKNQQIILYLLLLSEAIGMILMTAWY